MIIDHIDNAHMYYGLGPRLEQALKYLAQTDLEAAAIERYDLDGDNLFALVQEYETKRREDGFWEAHRQYADVQYLVSGTEHMGVAPIADLEMDGEYDPEKDFSKLIGEGTFCTMKPGTFVILFPQDAHMPGMAVDEPAPAKKAVVKVKLV